MHPIFSYYSHLCYVDLIFFDAVCVLELANSRMTCHWNIFGLQGVVLMLCSITFVVLLA
jgi:hypothetical protein